MKYVLTIIFEDRINLSMINDFFDNLPPNINIKWLNYGKVLDLLSDSYDTLSMIKLKGSRVDSYIQKVEERRKKLFVADMDSTIIQQECIQELAYEAGVKDEVTLITKKAMNGEMDFKKSLQMRVSLLKGLDISLMKKVRRERIDITAGAFELIDAMRANGIYCALLSGGFDFFTGYIAKKLGFNLYAANKLEIKDNKLTGNLLSPIVGPEEKLQILNTLGNRFALDKYQTMAIGDGANDIMMLQAAGLGIAFHAKPVVRKFADVSIAYGNLTSVLYLQGFAKQGNSYTFVE